MNIPMTMDAACRGGGAIEVRAVLRCRHRILGVDSRSRFRRERAALLDLLWLRQQVQAHLGVPGHFCRDPVRSHLSLLKISARLS